MTDSEGWFQSSQRAEADVVHLIYKDVTEDKGWFRSSQWAEAESLGAPQKGVAGKGGVGVAEGKGWFRSTTRAEADQGSDAQARTPPLPRPPTPHAPLTDNAVCLWAP